MSILNSSRYGSDESMQMQKMIQSLRLETQEALAASRDEIARIEEENEIKQMRIEEIDAELESLNKTRRKSIQPADSRGRARRRWSLAAIGVSLRHTGNVPIEQQEAPQRRAKSYVIESDSDSCSEEFRRQGNRRSPRKPNRSRLKSKTISDEESLQDVEHVLLQRLQETEEENERLIQQQETNLKFKEEQVIALRLTCEQQDDMIEALEEEIYRARLPVDGTNLDDEGSNQDDAEEMKRNLLSLNETENEISSQIRLIKRIKHLDPAAQKSAISVLKKDIVESAIRLKAIKTMFEERKEVLQRDLSIKENAWALSCAELNLMESVSQHQIIRLEENIASAESPDLADMINLATRALQEELSIRECSDEIARKVLQLESLNLEKLVVAMLNCCDAFAEGFLHLKSKSFSGRMGAGISDILRQMEIGISNAENVVSSALSVLEDTHSEYERDDMFLPEDVLAEYFSSSHTDDVLPDCEDEVAFSKSFIEDSDIRLLQQKNDEIEEQLRDARKIQEAKRTLQNCVHDHDRLKIKELESTYSKLCDQLDLKDEGYEIAMKNARDAKAAEDRLRAFLERTVRARLLK